MKEDHDEIQNGSQISRKSYDHDNNLIVTIYVVKISSNWYCLEMLVKI